MVERFVLSPAGQPVSYGIGSWAASVRACGPARLRHGGGAMDGATAAGGRSCWPPGCRRQWAIRYRVSTGEPLPTPYSRSQGRWRQPRVSYAPRCSALVRVGAGYRLITQRSLVQDGRPTTQQFWQRYQGIPRLAWNEIPHLNPVSSIVSRWVTNRPFRGHRNGHMESGRSRPRNGPGSRTCASGGVLGDAVASREKHDAWQPSGYSWPAGHREAFVNAWT